MEFLPFRTWTLEGDRKLRAELLAVMDGQVRLKPEQGEPLAVAVSALAEADRQFLERLEP